MTPDRHPLDGQSQADVLNEIAAEWRRARAKFDDQEELTDLQWQSVLLEEVGEVAKVITKREVPPVTPGDPDATLAQLRAELVQVAAVAARWLYVLPTERDIARLLSDAERVAR